MCKALSWHTCSHGISHLSQVPVHAFVCYTHQLKGSCVYQENSSDLWDVPQYSTQNHCITSMYSFLPLLSLKKHYFQNKQHVHALPFVTVSCVTYTCGSQQNSMFIMRFFKVLSTSKESDEFQFVHSTECHARNRRVCK